MHTWTWYVDGLGRWASDSVCFFLLGGLQVLWRLARAASVSLGHIRLGEVGLWQFSREHVSRLNSHILHWVCLLVSLIHFICAFGFQCNARYGFPCHLLCKCRSHCFRRMHPLSGWDIPDRIRSSIDLISVLRALDLSRV